MSIVDDSVSIVDIVEPADQRSAMAAVRPKLKLDTVFIESVDGVYFRNPARSFFVKGTTAYRWITTLRPYLTGEHTLGELCDGLDDAQVDTVVELVRTLIDRGVARDCATDSPPERLPAEMAELFRDQIGFVDHMADGDGPTRFARYRTTQVLLIGSGEALLGAADGLLRNGLAALTVAPADAEQPYAPLLADQAQRLAPCPPEVRVLPAGATAPTGDFDVVVYSGDSGDLRTAAELNERCLRSGTAFIPVVVVGDKVVLGPTVAAADGLPCWHCALLRLTVNAAATDAAAAWREVALGGAAERRIHSGNVARMIGGAAAFEVFRRRCGLETDTSGAVVVQDADTLESTRERLLAHPACPACAPTGSAEADPVVAELDDEQVYQRVGVLVGRHAGVVGEYADDALEQIPLKIARVRLGPVGSAPARELTAFDIDNVLAARITLLSRAATCYAGRLPGPRPGVRGGTSAELAGAGHRVAEPTELSTRSAPWTPGRHLRWVGARALDSGAEVLVPLAAAFPLSAANDDLLVERAAAGTGAGVGRAAAILDGLCNALAFDALRAVCAATAPVCHIAEDDLCEVERLSFLLKSFRHFGRAVEVFELPGARPGHAAIAVTDSAAGVPLWTIGTGASWDGAVGAALRDALGRIQVEHFERARPDLGDPLFADLDPGLDFARGGRGPRRATTAADMIAQLAAAGRTALFVDTTPPDIAASDAIVTGMVLLWTPAHSEKGH
ncbi:TOMM precursor leader peptide-binding protein [Actinokineospora sp.]|uniref:TOMM precursor leader peptide-binding protein n=1 Tax=Actinokineospora sp. TaxID=1872133 RepID=UPI00403828D2